MPIHEPSAVCKANTSPARFDLSSLPKGSFKRSFVLNIPAIEELLGRARQAKAGMKTLQATYEDGMYWTRPTYGPTTEEAWRKINIKNGVVRVVEPSHPDHEFTQHSFFDVNIMVGQA